MRHRTPDYGPEGLWIFGYGSLMWEPGFAHARAEPALVAGWHRRMSMVATKSYGWPGRPGLAAGLHPGGTVDGVAFLIPAAQVADVIEVLSRREWAYLTAEVTARLRGGARVRALTYVAHPTNGRFRMTQDSRDFLRRLHHGRGRKGHTADYVVESAAALDAHGVKQSDLHELRGRLGDFRRGGLTR